MYFGRARERFVVGAAMLKPGTHQVAADIVGRRLLDIGATNLMIKIGTQVASRGAHCWDNDVELQAMFRRPDGGKYHRESIGRARRMMARRGWIGSTRIFSHQKPTGAKWPTTHGTTSKYVAWKALGLRCPTTRGERRKLRKEAPPSPSLYNPRKGPVVSLGAMSAGLGSMPMPAFMAKRPLDDAGRREHLKREERERQERAEQNAAEQRRRLEAWIRENPDTEERGPP